MAKKKTSDVERRIVTGSEFEVRSNRDTRTIEGYSPVFGRYSKDLGGFVEKVDPGAFVRSIGKDNILGTYHHNRDMPIGSTKSGTMKLAVDKVGVHYEINVPNTSLGNDVFELAEARVIDSSSFGFRLVRTAEQRGDVWGHTDDGYRERTLMNGMLLDIGPVPPNREAYPDATAETRCDPRVALVGLVTESRSLDELVEAFNAGELSKILDSNGDPASETRTGVDQELIEMRRRRRETMERFFGF